MTTRETAEYEALRATIRDRGTARHWVVLVTFLGWVALVVATTAVLFLPVATLLPLFVLAAAFEVVFSLHTGVERIGRYLQVFHEDGSGGAEWEHQAMAYGQRFRGVGSDPLFIGFFVGAVFLNFMPVTLADAVPIEYAGVGAVHVLIILRMLVARRQAARQRAVDLERFRQLKQPAR